MRTPCRARTPLFAVLAAAAALAVGNAPASAECPPGWTASGESCTRWEQCGDFAGALREGAQAIASGGEAIFVNPDVSPVVRVDVATWRWRVGAAPPRARQAVQLWADAAGRVVVFGGVRPDGTPVGEVDVYDPASDAWTTVGALQPPRAELTATPLDGSRLLLLGGVDAEGRPSASAVVVDTSAGAVLEAGALSVARPHHRARRLADGRVLVAGAPAEDGEDVTHHVDETDETSQPNEWIDVYDPSSGGWSMLRPDASFSGWLYGELCEAVELPEGLLLVGADGGSLLVAVDWPSGKYSSRASHEGGEWWDCPLLFESRRWGAVAVDGSGRLYRFERTGARWLLVAEGEEYFEELAALALPDGRWLIHEGSREKDDEQREIGLVLDPERAELVPVGAAEVIGSFGRVALGDGVLVHGWYTNDLQAEGERLGHLAVRLTTPDLSLSSACPRGKLVGSAEDHHGLVGSLHALDGRRLLHATHTHGDVEDALLLELADAESSGFTPLTSVPPGLPLGFGPLSVARTPQGLAVMFGPSEGADAYESEDDEDGQEGDEAVEGDEDDWAGIPRAQLWLLSPEASWRRLEVAWPEGGGGTFRPSRVVAGGSADAVLVEGVLEPRPGSGRRRRAQAVLTASSVTPVGRPLEEVVEAADTYWAVDDAGVLLRLAGGTWERVAANDARFGEDEDEPSWEALWTLRDGLLATVGREWLVRVDATGAEVGRWAWDVIPDEDPVALVGVFERDATIDAVTVFGSEAVALLELLPGEDRARDRVLTRAELPDAELRRARFYPAEGGGTLLQLDYSTWSDEQSRFFWRGARETTWAPMTGMPPLGGVLEPVRVGDALWFSDGGLVGRFESRAAVVAPVETAE
jgi:hypothetical protein